MNTQAVQTIPLVAPTITDLDTHAMHNAINLGLLTHGLRETERYETMFAERIGCRWAVAVNSGTSALTIALHARGILLGQTLLIPSWSCVAIRNAAQALGCNIRYTDTSWDVASAQAFTDNYDPAHDSVITHMFGNPTAMTGDAAVEDFTLSLGQPYRSGLGICSTHHSKMISTARGGIIFGDNDALHQRIRELVHYDTHTRFGYSAAITPMQAALGVSQLVQLDDFIERRQHLADRYTTAFQPAGIPCPDPDCGSVFFRYLIRVDSPARSVADLAERGIEAGRGVNPPLHQLAGHPDPDFPGTMAAVNSLLSVPVHPSITDRQADHIIRSVLEVCAP